MFNFGRPESERCPNCGTPCPLNSPTTRRQKYDLILLCPNEKCRREFIVKSSGRRKKIKKETLSVRRR